jgi:hypothetical protein
LPQEPQIQPPPPKLSDVNVTYANVTTTGNTTESGIDLGLLPPLPAGTTFTGFAYDISSTAVYQSGTPGDVQVCFNLPALSPTLLTTLQIRHLESGVWQNRKQPTGNTYQAICTAGLSDLGRFAIVVQAPTAASVSVSGRVMTADGRGLRNAIVTLTSPTGKSYRVSTGASGAYSIEGVTAGQTVIVNVAAKRYVFSNSMQVINVNNDVTGLVFKADR